jgi:hypothetical protein
MSPRLDVGGGGDRNWVNNIKYIISNFVAFFDLCGDGFMDFIHRPKSKILKY